jgi:TatD DNase family protein
VVLETTPDLVDTHCHLNFDVYNVDRKNVVERAKANGISRILVPGIDIETSKTAIDYAWEFDTVYAAVGLHPNQGFIWSKNTITDLRKLASKKKVVAIGEIGLDYYRDRTPIILQLTIFEEQLQLAKEFGLPVVVHNRNASDDILKIIKKWHNGLISCSNELADHPGVLHSFSGDDIFASEMISLNFKIGISGPVTYKKSQLLQSVVIGQPIQSILVETDAPFLTPIPFRGKRNEPANVRIVTEKISELKNESLEKVAQITTVEADKLFRWREIN